MNVNEVKKAQKIIRSAKIDLAMIVKKHLESGNPLMVNNLKPFDVSITDLFADQRVPVQIFFKDCETSLQIQVDLICRLPSDCIYIISCEELGIYNYYPGTNNDISAQEKQISVTTQSEMVIWIRNLIWLKLNFVITIVNK